MITHSCMCQDNLASSTAQSQSAHQSVFAQVTKNWQPFESGPLFACHNRPMSEKGMNTIYSANPSTTVHCAFARLSRHNTLKQRVPRTMDSRPGPVCFPMKFSSANRLP